MALLLATGTLSAAAQDLRVKSMVVYKTDGTRDTIMLKSSNSYFYGKENPVDGDYIRGHIWTNTNKRTSLYRSTLYDSFEYSCNLTEVGRNSPYTVYGYMISSNPITTAPDFSNSKGYSELYTKMYFVDKNKWYGRQYSSNTKTLYLFDEDENSGSQFPMHLGLSLGTTYYARAFMMLDDKVYYGEEQSFRTQRTRFLVYNVDYQDYSVVNDSVIYAVGSTIYFGEDNTVVGRGIASEYVGKVLKSLSEEELLAIVTKTEDCDDGTLYVIEQVSDEIVNQARAMMEQEAMQEFFVEASLDNVLTVNSVTTTTFGTYKCTPSIMTCSDTIGVRDNKCFYTNPTMRSSAPQLSVKLDHIMLPGQEYEVSFTFVPGMTKADTLATYFKVYIADGQGNAMYDDTFPALANAKVYGNDTIVNNRKCFQASATEPTTITLRYTPTRLTFCHALQLQHVVSFSIASQRNTYGQRFCISGISVKPVKD